MITITEYDLQEAYFNGNFPIWVYSGNAVSKEEREAWERAWDDFVFGETGSRPSEEYLEFGYQISTNY